jgi:hypothetical protein
LVEKGIDVSEFCWVFFADGGKFWRLSGGLGFFLFIMEGLE